jgi:nitrogenase molybdenum-cofactor synthesis protein NifE
MGVNIISTLTGDSHVDEIAQAHRAKLNIVQCQKSSNYVAKKMEEKYGIPFIKVNFFGLEQTVNSMREIADFFGDEEMIERTEKIIESGLKEVEHKIEEYKERLTGKTVALYVGGNKAWSLVRPFEELGMDVMMSGTKNGIREDYEMIKEAVRDGTIIVDDANSSELTKLLKEHRPNLLISGAKEKYISLKLGIPFCDFNHDRITAFAGFKGFVSFAKEVDASVSSPVFELTSKSLRGD